MVADKKRDRGYLGLIGALLAAASGGAFVYFKFFNGSELTPQDAAKLIPQDALMSAYISTDPQQWSNLQRFGSPELQKLLGQQLQQFSQEAKLNTNVEYTKDVQPWLGNVMVTILPNSSTTTQNSSSLTIVGIKNKLKALESFNKLKDKQQINSLPNKHQGVDIFEVKQNSPNGASSQFMALLGDELLIAENIQTIQKTIDISQGKPSLASKPGINEFYAQDLGLKNSLIKVYIPDYQAVLNQGGQTLPPDLVKALVPKSMILGMGLEDQGLHIKAITNMNAEAIKWPVKSFEPKVISRFSNQTIMMINGKGLNQGWSTLVTQAEKIPEFKLGLTQLRDSFQAYNFDLDKDIFSWLDGEIALAFINSPQVPYVNTGVALLVETSDRPTGENTLNKVQQLIQNQAPFITPGNVDIEGKKVTEYKLGPDLALNTGWISDNSLVVTLGVPFVDFVKPQGNNSLTQNPTFIELTKPLPKNNLGYSYLDMQKFNGFLKNITTQQGTTVPPEANAVLDSVTGIASASTFINDSTGQLDIVVGLVKQTPK